MFTRFLVMSLFAAALTACGDAADFRKKVINSDNGEPLILFAAGTYETARSFMTIGDLLDDGVGFCVSGDAVFVAPPASSPVEEFVQITFIDCVDENGIAYNGPVTMTIAPYTDWENLEYSLELTGLQATSDEWFGGTASVSGSLDYVVTGKAGTVDLPGGTFTTEVVDDGQLALDALNITVELDTDNPEITETSVDGSGEQSSKDFSAPLTVTFNTPSVLTVDTSDADLLCPQTGELRVTATQDGSYASVQYPSGTNNVYQIRTNGSFINQKDCI